MSIGRRWASLTDQTDLAQSLFGDRGYGLVADWLDHEVSRIDNAEFAREFSDHIDLPGVESIDYAHRRVRSQRGELVGGIRFYNRNVGRPFVDVFAHSFDDIAALADCVRDEWAIFGAPFMRLRAVPGRLAGHHNVLDQSIHVGRYDQMASPDGRVQLKRFDDVDDAITIVMNRYRCLAGDQPELANNIAPAQADDLRLWHDRGQLRAICVADVVVGLLAIAPGSIGWITGDEINEEVVSAAHAGHRYATSAQCAWAADVAADRQRFLIGTIDRHNDASRRSAERAGRRRVLDDVFVPLAAANGGQR